MRGAYAEGLQALYTEGPTSKAHPDAEGPRTAHPDARVFACMVYAEGPASLLLIGISPKEGVCTRKVRDTSHLGTVRNLILYAEGPR